MNSKLNNSRIILIIFSISFFLFWKSDKSVWEGKTLIIDEVKIVKNPRIPIYNSNVLKLEEDLSIGNVNDTNFFFSFIGKIAVDEKNNIFVSDTGERCIKVYDDNGNYIKTIGRKGQGPGEFGSLSSISIINKNELIVEDISQHRFAIFKTEGKFIKNLNNAREMINFCKFDSLGNIIGIRKIRDSVNPRIELGKYDPSLKHLYLLETLPLAQKDNQTFRHLESRLVYAVTTKNYIVVGGGNEYKIKKFDPEGKLRMLITKDHHPLKIGKDVITLFKEGLRGNTKIEIPKYFPPIRNICVDCNDRIYVQTFEKGKSQTHLYYDIFDRDGRYIAKKLLGKRISLFNGKLYSIETNKFGYQFIKRYKVKWNN